MKIFIFPARNRSHIGIYRGEGGIHLFLGAKLLCDLLFPARNRFHIGIYLRVGGIHLFLGAKLLCDLLCPSSPRSVKKQITFIFKL